jgi:2-oxoglutarate ferredoxin oxidoreductase subunit alpha
VSAKNAGRCKNFFTLGMMYWLYGREPKNTIEWIRKKFAKKPDIAQANEAAVVAGYSYCDTVELFETTYVVPKAPLMKGTYKRISGNEATALGFVAASVQAKKQLFLGSYPITPATDILNELAAQKHFGIRTFQAEDEIAGACSAIGAAFAGNIAITTTSGPGVCLKSEAMNLAVMAELPVVIVNVQRGGPSTGMPTKTEQSDLLQALYGRNGDSPMPVIAAKTPGDCFWAARVHDTRCPAHRRLHRQRRRALPHSRDRGSAQDRGRLRTGPSHLQALPAQRQGRTPLGHSRDSRLGAPDWWIGEGQPLGHGQPRSREPPENDDRAP